MGISDLLRMEVSDQDVIEARAIMAEVVESCGDKFLPLFEALDREMTRRNDRKIRLCAVTAIDPVMRKRALRRRSRTRSSETGARSS